MKLQQFWNLGTIKEYNSWKAEIKRKIAIGKLTLKKKKNFFNQ